MRKLTAIFAALGLFMTVGLLSALAAATQPPRHATVDNGLNAFAAESDKKAAEKKSAKKGKKATKKKATKKKAAKKTKDATKKPGKKPGKKPAKKPGKKPGKKPAKKPDTEKKSDNVIFHRVAA
jgi:hypothetical protein